MNIAHSNVVMDIVASSISGVSRLEGLVGPQTCKFSMCSLIQQLQEKNLS